ncbi:hypothetical protein ANO11243_053990 [Dothideomycetidae sp. 11243]|nr:hypothetical protein ANO11243_053990 [fungal sp. No.11243]
MATQPVPLSTQLHALGVTAALVYSGFSFGASYLTVPLVIPLPARHATVFFRDFFYNGATAMVPLSLLGAAACATGSYVLRSNARSAEGVVRVLGQEVRASTLGYIAAAALMAGLPWTQAVMMAVNNRLIALAADPGASDRAAAEVVDLLRQWRWMNFVRSTLGLVGGVLGLSAIVGQK